MTHTSRGSGGIAGRAGRWSAAHPWRAILSWLALVAQGLTNDEIATELVLSPATARTHVSRAMVKLHARDRAQLVVFAYQSGLVRPTT